MPIVNGHQAETGIDRASYFVTVACQFDDHASPADAVRSMIDWLKDDAENAFYDVQNVHTGEKVHGSLDELIMNDDDARYVCDGCGRIGTVDDGISGDGGECPDEDCDGTVHRLMEES